MYEKEFVSDRLTQVRDVFLFCCYTGLAYVDVKKLTKSHINIGIDGEQWIFTRRQKTDTSTRVPLLPVDTHYKKKSKERITVYLK